MKKILFIILSIVSVASATQLFEKCASCHGKKGEKHSKGLTKSIAGMNAKDVTNILQEYKAGKRNTYGLGTMMQGQTSKLSDANIEELAAYVASLAPVVEIAAKPKLTSEMTTEEIFEKCGICHGEKGQKKSLGVSRKIAGMDAAEIVKDLKEYKAGTRSTYGYGVMMQGQATKLSANQMNAIAILIQSLPPVKSEEENITQGKANAITQEQIDYNKFMDEYFKNSTNPNETFEAAKKKYEEHQKILKENK